MKPPGFGEAVLAGLIRDRAVADDILGDFAEEWDERASLDGHASADSWYWRQVVSSAPHLLRLWWRESRWYTVLGVLGAAIVLRASAIVLSYAGMAVAVLGLRAVGSFPTLTAAASLVAVAGSMACVGAATARFARRAPLVLLAAVLLASMVLEISAFRLLHAASLSPMSYWIGVRLLALPALALGALPVLRARVSADDAR
jgi:hypothetical protein